jgi:hypothetical protein
MVSAEKNKSRLETWLVPATVISGLKNKDLRTE